MKIILLSLSIALFSVATAQESKKPVDSKIDNVTIFLSGAQVTRKATVTLQKGTTDLVFNDVSTSVNAQSIQISSDNDLTVLSVNHQINYIEEPAKREEITKLEAQLKSLKEKVSAETAMLQVYQQEENMLIKNQSIGGANAVLKAQDLKDAMDFQRTRMTEVKNKQLEISQRIFAYNQDISKIQLQLGGINSQNNKLSGEIVVSVMTKEAGVTKLELKYVVNNAGWYPSYDLRVTDISKPMFLKYKANVYQSSGEDWSNVKLILSSGNPQESGTKPNLEPWNLYSANIKFTPPVIAPDEQVKEEMRSQPQLEENQVRISIADVKAREKVNTMPTVTVTEGQTAFRFEIDQPYNIPADGKEHTVDVRENAINAIYEYYCVPKLDKDVFLTARIINWEELNLLEGEANLYYEGTYLGKATLDTQNSKDTLDISLGRDKNIVVNRIKLKEFSRNQIFGSSKTDERSWEISIRNKKTQPINITVEDQFPTSTNKDIVVDKGDYKEASLDDTTNKLTWRLKIDPAKEKKVGFKYTVKSPKNMPVILE